MRRDVELCDMLLFSNANINAMDWKCHVIPTPTPLIETCQMFVVVLCSDFPFIRKKTALHYILFW